jgi:hypothetical protein
MNTSIKNKKISPLRWLLISLLIFALSALLAAFTTQFIPPVFVGSVQIEFFLLILLYAGLLFVLFKKRKQLFVWCSIVFIVLLLCFSLIGIGWSPRIIVWNVFNNIYFLFKSSISSQVDIKPSDTAVFPHISLQQRIQQKVNGTDSIVRAFSVQYSLLFFDEYYPKYRQICRQFSLLKYIKDNFKYVSDPSNFDYFASPQESIKLMAGDCDDYSILMASVLGAIGAKVRIIWAPHHVYPELYCGAKPNFDKYINAIYIFFEQEIEKKQIYYRIDKHGDYWLNIDYTDKYPGSVYQSNEVLSIIYIK